MSKAFSCPNCHASLEFEGGISPTIRCQYCNTTVIVPEELRTSFGGRVGLGDVPELAKLTEVARLIQQGKKIEAIKLVREISAMDLKAAKEAVERMERGEEVRFSAISSPHTITTTPHPLQQQPTAVSGSRRAGCFVLLVVVGLLLLTTLPLFLFTNIFNTVSEAIAPAVESAVSNTEPGLPRPTATLQPSPTPGFATEVFSFGGEEGIGPGTFNDTRHIGIDAEGRIYTADYQDGRIQAYDSQGNFLAQWLVNNPKSPTLAMAVDRQGRVYAVQQGAITRYDGLSGEAQLTIPSPAGAGFRDVVIAPDGKLVAYAYLPPDTLFWFDSAGNLLQSVPQIISSQTENPELTARIAVDGLGNVYLLGEGFTPVVFKYDAEGKFITRIGSKGNDLGQLNSPRAVAIDNQGRLYVADTDGIDVFAGDGRYLDTIPFSGVAFDMVFNDRNELFLMERNGNRVIQLAVQAGAQGK